MTDNQVPPSPAETATLTPPPVSTPPTGKNTIGLVALILAGAGLLFAVIPATAGVAWLFIIPAIVLAIIALVKRRQPRWFGLVAVIVAPIAWLIAIIVTVAAIATGASQAFQEGFDEALDDNPAATAAPAEPESEEEQDAAEESSGDATLGETVTNNRGVAVTFTTVTCGLPQAGPEFMTETAKGQFCEVRYTVQNGSDEQISLWASDVTGQIGGVDYEANTSVSMFGDDYFTTELNPGLGADAVVYIDIPADKALETVTFVPQWSLFTDDIVVKIG